MSWVKEARSTLEAGQIARVRQIGGSMRGRIESGQLVTIAPNILGDRQAFGTRIHRLTQR